MPISHNPLVLCFSPDGAPRLGRLPEQVQSLGVTVKILSNEPEALDSLGSSPVCLALVAVGGEGAGEGPRLIGEIRQRWPAIPVLACGAAGQTDGAVAALRAGAADYLGLPVSVESLRATLSRYPLEAVYQNADPVIARDPRTLEVLGLARRVAATAATVLIYGESGTGKEVFARYIHQTSPRRHGPFIALNCAAIPDNMLEALLFGYEKGAFTGAYQSAPGKFEQAQGGTMLLDEISEMSLDLQAKLLRVLQEREVERLGGRKPISLDVRVLATTNRRLREEVSAGRFREDLYYRLNVFPLALPPLRERPADILPLAEYLIRTRIEPGRPPLRLGQAARDALQGYRWPGNVRELDNLIQRALILCPGDEIDPRDLRFEETPVTESVDILVPMPTADTSRHWEGTIPAAHREDLRGDVRVAEGQMILKALASSQGSRKSVAQRLGISERTLRYKLQRLRETGTGLSQAASQAG